MIADDYMRVYSRDPATKTRASLEKVMALGPAYVTVVGGKALARVQRVLRQMRAEGLDVVARTTEVDGTGATVLKIRLR